MVLAPSADSRVALIGRLFDHLAWADAEIALALVRSDAPAGAIREYAHVVGAEETWLSRIEGRASAAAIWPELRASDAARLASATADGFRQLIDRTPGSAVDALVKYTNSAGKTFETPLIDILLHVALHGQYHRGKVNQILRQAGTEPAPVDFISFVRGVPAATQATSKG